MKDKIINISGFLFVVAVFAYAFAGWILGYQILEFEPVQVIEGWLFSHYKPVLSLSNRIHEGLNMQNKINQLILTGKTSLKGCNRGPLKNWISEKTQTKLENYLLINQGIDQSALRRVDDQTIAITGHAAGVLKLFGLINLY